MKKLTKIISWLIYLLPAVLFCSYYPIISFGSNDSMNFEFSLPLIWLVIFDVVAFMAFILLNRKKLRTTSKSTRQTHWGFDFAGLSDRRFFLFSLLPFFATLSILWSSNPLRAFLTAGIIWLIFFAIFAILFLVPLLNPSTKFKTHCLQAFLISSLAICIVCWVQCFLDVFGVTRDTTLLCLGCTYRSFGFPHPSGFAIEPQFMGNLLLAPTLTALYLLVSRRSSLVNSSKLFSRLSLALLAVIFSSTLFLTFSRGAIYAYAIALVVLIIFFIVQRRFRPVIIIIPALTFILTLSVQGAFAALSPTSETFYSGISKSLHQLSLGIIDIRQPESTDSSTESSQVQGQTQNQASTSDSAAIFDGYVPESTNVRLNLNSVAFQTWLSSPWNILFGVGLGGAGVSMHQLYPNEVSSAKEIVQNQFFSLLLELGLIGIALVVLIFYLALFSPWGHQRLHAFPALPLFVSLIVAYLITLNFFSGLPNALHIYLLPPLLFVIFSASNSPKTIK